MKKLCQNPSTKFGMMLSFKVYCLLNVQTKSGRKIVTRYIVQNFIIILKITSCASLVWHQILHTRLYLFSLHHVCFPLQLYLNSEYGLCCHCNQTVSVLGCHFNDQEIFGDQNIPQVNLDRNVQSTHTQILHLIETCILLSKNM